MFPNLLQALIRSVGAPFVQLDAAMPGTILLTVPGIFLILVIAALAVLIVSLFRRRRRKQLEQEARRTQAQYASPAEGEKKGEE